MKVTIHMTNGDSYNVSMMREDLDRLIELIARQSTRPFTASAVVSNHPYTFFPKHISHLS